MATLANAVKAQKTVTENDMVAFESSMDDCVDLFYKVGAMRGKNVVPLFQEAYKANPEVALRIMAWSRDARGGAGEREHFRNVLRYLDAKGKVNELKSLMNLVPEIGRWDDLWVVKQNVTLALRMFREALNAGNGLCAKWMPRKGPNAVLLRKYMALTPKQYRKLLVRLTKVVETQMCAGEWSEINYNHVPSRAGTIYRKAFGRHDQERYAAWLNDLQKDNSTAKVNASVLFPHEVYKNDNVSLAEAQWKALPNYVGDASILPLVDVSGSMYAAVAGSNTVRAMDVSVALGVYLAEKNQGKFKDLVMTFSTDPEFIKMKGENVKGPGGKFAQVEQGNWGMSTDLEAALRLILKTAVKGKVPQEEMPKTLLILSDMQFNQCVENPNATANKMLRKMYKDAGYEVPNVVFWNLRDAGNMPARADKKGVGLVSGFSPAIVKSVLTGKSFTPRDIMLETVMKDRYALT